MVAHCDEVRACLRRDDYAAAADLLTALSYAALDFLVLRAASACPLEPVFKPLAFTWTALLRACKLGRALDRLSLGPARLCLETLQHFLPRHRAEAMAVPLEYLRKLLGEA